MGRELRLAEAVGARDYLRAGRGRVRQYAFDVVLAPGASQAQTYASTAAPLEVWLASVSSVWTFSPSSLSNDVSDTTELALRGVGPVEPGPVVVSSNSAAGGNANAGCSPLAPASLTLVPLTPALMLAPMSAPALAVPPRPTTTREAKASDFSFALLRYP